MGASKSSWFSLLLLCLIFNLTLARKIQHKRSEQGMRTPVCEPDSVCGVVQVNSRGLTAYPICTCPDHECPLVWDDDDGTSVNHGAMQYKHCGRAPKHLSPCAPDQTAYTMTILTPMSPDDITMKISHKIHCKCPDNSLHTPKGEDSQVIPFVGEAKSYSLTCASYPLCEEEEACKTLSETKTEFLENKLCQCADGSHCPVAGNRKSKSFEFGRGKVTQLFCQR